MMNAFDERSRSLWMDTVVADVPALSENKRVDTVVIGSGIAGLSSAYELARRGQKILVLDRGRIAGGMTSRTSAHLTSQSDDGFKTLINNRGLEGARTFYMSHAAAIDRIETITREEDIECHFRRVNGYLFPAIGKDAAEELTPEFEATKKVGMPIERHTGLPFTGLENVRSLRYPNLATFHPLRYLRGVADAFVRYGGELFANTAVTAVQERDGLYERATKWSWKRQTRSSPPIHRSATGLRFTRSSRRIVPTPWQSPSSATASRTHYTGIRWMLITMSGWRTVAAPPNT
jgi:hypothetical protein